VVTTGFASGALALDVDCGAALALGVGAGSALGACAALASADFAGSGAVTRAVTDGGAVDAVNAVDADDATGLSTSRRVATIAIRIATKVTESAAIKRPMRLFGAATSGAAGAAVFGVVAPGARACGSKICVATAASATLEVS
jgi:hypothetical protein